MNSSRPSQSSDISAEKVSLVSRRTIADAFRTSKTICGSIANVIVGAIDWIIPGSFKRWWNPNNLESRSEKSWSRQTAAMRRGIQMEPVVIEKLRDLGYNVEKSTKLYEQTFQCEGRTHTLIGKVDGLIRNVDGNVDVVVEIKTRMHRSFIPEYDVDQLAAYVYLTGARYGMLVQMFEDEIQTKLYKKETLLKRWKEIVKKLPRAVAYLDELKQAAKSA